MSQYLVFWTFGIFGWWLPDGSYVQPPHRDDYRRAGLVSQADCDRYRAVHGRDQPQGRAAGAP